jgi:uncharacterized protein (UPF0332 family)
MKTDPLVITEKIDRALECIDEAELLMKSAHYNTAINRLYYGMFYAAGAALLKNDIIAKSHSGAKNQFHLNFVKTGVIDEETGKLYDNLFSQRNECDYGDFVNFGKEDVEGLIDEVKNSIELIKRLLINAAS